MLAYSFWPSLAGYRWLHGGDYPEWDETTEEQKLSIVHAYLVRNHSSLEDVFSGEDVLDDNGNKVGISRDLKVAASNLSDFSTSELNDMFAKEFGMSFNPTTQVEPESTSLLPQPEQDSPLEVDGSDDK